MVGLSQMTKKEIISEEMSKRGKQGGAARSRKLSKKRKKEIASQGGKALWARIKKGNL